MPASGTVIIQQSYNWITNEFTLVGALTNAQVGACPISWDLKGVIPFYKLSFVNSAALNILEISDMPYNPEAQCWGGGLNKHMIHNKFMSYPGH